MNRLFSWFKKLFVKQGPSSLAIVRRYLDANGSFVGELYVLGSFAGVAGYHMIGVSLDTLPFAAREVGVFTLDTEHDFLAPMPEGYVRVGAQDPRDNDRIRSEVRRMSKNGPIVLQVQNRFVEHVLSQPGKGDTLR